MYNNYKTTEQKFQEVLNYIKTIDEKLYALFKKIKPYEDDDKVILYCAPEIGHAIRRRLSIFPNAGEIKRNLEKIMGKPVEIKEEEPYSFLELAEELVELGYINYIEREDIDTIRKEFFKKGYSETCLIALLYNFKNYLKKIRIQNPVGFLIGLIRQDEIEKYIPKEVLEKEKENEFILSLADIITLPKRESIIDLEKYFPVERVSGILPVGVLFKGRKKGKIIKFETTVLENKEKGIKFKYVMRNPDGVPGPLSYDLRRLITELYLEFRNPVIEISAYEICKRLGLKPGTLNYRIIKEELKRMLHTEYSVEIISAKSQKDTKERITGDKPLPKLIITQMETREVIRRNRVDMHFTLVTSPILTYSVENKNYFPVNRALFFALKNKTARRIYEIISPKLFGRKDSPYIKYNYQIFCSLVGIKTHKKLSYMKRVLEPAFKELQEKGIIKKYEFLREGKNKIIKLFP